MKVVLAGGSGSLGRSIGADLAERGDEVVVLSRSSRPGGPHRQVTWDGATVGPWAAELPGAALINLAGALVDHPPTPANIELLTRSRVEPTKALAEAVTTLDRPPTVWLQMSTLAIYGDAGDAVLDETARPADGPAQMAGVARAWESSASGINACRQVVLRSGIVFAPGTPAFDRLAGLTRWGLGGRIGSGRQWISWLHVQDFLGIVRRVLNDASLSGVTHATSPNPVRNVELMATFRSVFNRPTAPPTPAWLLRMGAIVLRSDPALALTGRRGIPTRLLDAGFVFSHPELGAALVDLRESTR